MLYAVLECSLHPDSVHIINDQITALHMNLLLVSMHGEKTWAVHICLQWKTFHSRLFLSVSPSFCGWVRSPAAFTRSLSDTGPINMTGILSFSLINMQPPPPITTSFILADRFYLIFNCHVTSYWAGGLWQRIVHYLQHERLCVDWRQGWCCTQVLFIH